MDKFPAQQLIIYIFFLGKNVLQRSHIYSDNSLIIYIYHERKYNSTKTTRCFLFLIRNLLILYLYTRKPLFPIPFLQNEKHIYIFF